MDFLPLIIQLVSGAAGGNIIAKFIPSLNLGGLGNSLSGILGGGIGGSVLGALGMAAEPSGALDIAALAGSVGSGAVGGGIVMTVIGFIKKMMNKA